MNWLRRIKELRLEGEKGRKFPPQFMVCREYRSRVKPAMVWDRDAYFSNLL
ncbi:MAG: hypothetical protein AAB777_02945 [Patescibacteria group bacterium]